MCFTMIALGVILSFLFVIMCILTFKFACVVFNFSEWLSDAIDDLTKWIFYTFERMWQR